MEVRDFAQVAAPEAFIALDFFDKLNMDFPAFSCLICPDYSRA
jgi:hypothetical protein